MFGQLISKLKQNEQFDGEVKNCPLILCASKGLKNNEMTGHEAE